MAPGLDFLKASAPDSARSEGGSSAQNTGRSGGSTARSDASGGGGGGGGGNIFGDAGKPRAKRGGLLGADANELAAETNNLQAYSTKAAEAKAKEEYQKSAAERKVRLMRIYSEMLAKAGIENKAAGKHLERLGNMNYSDKMQTGRLSERMYDDIRKERKFDRFNRPVRQKGSRQKALVANIKSQFMSKSDAREDDAEFVDPNSRRLKTAKWKIGYRKWVRAPPGLAESVVSVLNSDGNEDIFSWDGEWADGGMNGFGRFEFIDKNTFDGKMIKNVPNGPAISRYANGHVYDGEFLNGKFHGFGKMSYGSGSVYEGTWKNGRRHGNGTLTFPSGCTYKGDWLLGKQHGFGTVTSKVRKRKASACVTRASRHESINYLTSPSVGRSVGRSIDRFGSFAARRLRSARTGVTSHSER